MASLVARLGSDVERHEAVERPPHSQTHGGPVQQPVDQTPLQVDRDPVCLLRHRTTGYLGGAGLRSPHTGHMIHN